MGEKYSTWEQHEQRYPSVKIPVFLVPDPACSISTPGLCNIMACVHSTQLLLGPKSQRELFFQLTIQSPGPYKGHLCEGHSFSSMETQECFVFVFLARDGCIL